MLRLCRRVSCLANVAKAIVVGLVATLVLPKPAVAEPLRGAGSTFAAPIIQQWGKAYTAARADGGDFTSPDWLVDYEPVGSLAGVMRLQQAEIDFAATDTPLSPDELRKRGYRQFPVVIGGIAVVVNLGTLQPGRLQLSGAVIANIYLGAITRWSDPAIKALNPDVPLPDLAISPIFRQDGSGSTYVFSDFLASVSPEWKAKVGVDTLLKWPVGSGAEGSQGVIRAVGSRSGAIAYVESGQVSRAGLSHARIQNRDGVAVQPDTAGFQAAVTAVDWTKTDSFNAALVNQPGASAYPLTTAVFVVTPDASRSAARIARVHDLFRTAFDKGGADAARLGYVPLPPALVQQVKDSWTSTKRPGG